TYSWRPVRPRSLSPFLKSGWRDSVISARPKARMTSSSWTGGMYWGMSAIQTRMVGSMERYLTRARAWPSSRGRIGDSESWRTSGVMREVGREARMSWRLVGMVGRIADVDGRAVGGGAGEREKITQRHRGRRDSRRR